MQSAYTCDMSADDPRKLIVRGRPIQASIRARLTRQSKESFAMSQTRKANSNDKPVAVVIGATSKWQSDGRNTLLVHGKALDDSDLPVGARWGIGGAIA